MSNRAVFLDRDGVVNADSGYVHRREDFRFVPGIFEALRAIAELGYRLIIVTNQSGIGRGFYSEEEFAALTEWMLAQLAGEGISIDGVFHCPHLPRDRCACRKPAPGMILEAARRLQIELRDSWLIGDRDSDIAAAHAAGIRRTILFDPAGGADASSTKALFVCRRLCDTVGIVSPSQGREAEPWPPRSI